MLRSGGGLHLARLHASTLPRLSPRKLRGEPHCQPVMKLLQRYLGSRRGSSRITSSSSSWTSCFNVTSALAEEPSWCSPIGNSSNSRFNITSALAEKAPGTCPTSNRASTCFNVTSAPAEEAPVGVRRHLPVHRASTLPRFSPRRLPADRGPDFQPARPSTLPRLSLRMLLTMLELVLTVAGLQRYLGSR